MIIIGLKCTCTVVHVTKELNQRFSVGRKSKTSSYNDQSWQIHLKRHFIETTRVERRTIVRISPGDKKFVLRQAT